MARWRGFVLKPFVYTLTRAFVNDPSRRGGWLGALEGTPARQLLLPRDAIHRRAVGLARIDWQSSTRHSSVWRRKGTGLVQLRRLVERRGGLTLDSLQGLCIYSYG